MVKNPPANAGDMDQTPGSGRFPGGGSGYPFQHSCLENPMEKGAWWATVHEVTKVRHDLSTEYVRMYTLLKGRVHAVYLFASKMKFTTEKI